MRLIIYLFSISVFMFTHAWAQEHGHNHAHNGPAKIQVSPGTQFKADENLRTRMDQIYLAATSLFLSQDKNDPEKVKSAGLQMEKIINEIFSSCKLEPAADQAIHPILAELLNAANLLKKGSGEEGHQQIHKAFAQYDSLFTPKLGTEKK